ncbi:site-specific DNA-methyltransferase [Aliarcobacter lanthieri]|uniref:site-specific DNA-methyltransferase n=1 Tax=Aliarcobacter lanthieri TaxID=1355374 RepID=UPI003AADA02B
MSLKKNVIEEQSINDVNYVLLKKQFPHAVSIDENGKYAIDPQKLQMSLDPSKAQIKEDGYGLNWVGKKEAYHNAFTKNYKVLKPLKDDSKNWNETENILIKGNNLDALKILRQNYFESIKMIYIDPPYNTKNDGFIYNDDFTSSTEQTLEELGYDKQYIDYIENIQGSKTHSGWLNFMYPRLLLAHDLLKNEGVILISIDDNEVAQLKLLCDEIFDESNFVGEIIRKTKSMTGDEGTGLNNQHENLIIYAKEKDKLFLNGEIKTYNEYKNPDNDLKGDWKSGDPSAKSGGDSTYFEIKNPYTNKIDLPPSGRYWAFSKKTFEKYIESEKIIFKKEYADKERGFTFKVYKNELKTKYNPVNSLFSIDNQFMNQVGTKELKNLFDNLDIFNNPKPIIFIQKLIQYTMNENDLILDFFAGSGTTAHAVMDLNAKDNGNRKFICVQWAEKTPEKSEAKKAGYETIFDITKARIDKAGEQLAKGDIGFRTFEIVEDQKQKIYQKSLEEVNQDDLLVMMEKPDISSNEEILYNLFVAEALPLSTKHQELIKDKLYLASNVAFILGDITSDELVEALKDKKECEYITVYSPNISNDKFTLEIESNISKFGIKSDKLRFRG